MNDSLEKTTHRFLQNPNYHGQENSRLKFATASSSAFSGVRRFFQKKEAGLDKSKEHGQKKCCKDSRFDSLIFEDEKRGLLSSAQHSTIQRKTRNELEHCRFIPLGNVARVSSQDSVETRCLQPRFIRCRFNNQRSSELNSIEPSFRPTSWCKDVTKSSLVGIKENFVSRNSAKRSTLEMSERIEHCLTWSKSVNSGENFNDKYLSMVYDIRTSRATDRSLHLEELDVVAPKTPSPGFGEQIDTLNSESPKHSPSQIKSPIKGSSLLFGDENVEALPEFFIFEKNLTTPLCFNSSEEDDSDCDKEVAKWNKEYINLKDAHTQIPAMGVNRGPRLPYCLLNPSSTNGLSPIDSCLVKGDIENRKGDQQFSYSFLRTFEVSNNTQSIDSTEKIQGNEKTFRSIVKRPRAA